MEERITLLQAYKSMLLFWENFYYQNGQPNNLKGFLGDLQIISGNKTADPASWFDWLDAVNKVLSEEDNQ